MDVCCRRLAPWPERLTFLTIRLVFQHPQKWSPKSGFNAKTPRRRAAKEEETHALARSMPTAKLRVKRYSSSACLSSLASICLGAFAFNSPDLCRKDIRRRSFDTSSTDRIVVRDQELVRDNVPKVQRGFTAEGAEDRRGQGELRNLPPRTSVPCKLPASLPGGGDLA